MQEERATVADRAKMKADFSALTADDVEDMLGWAPLMIAHEEFPTDVPHVRRTLGALVARIEYDPNTAAVQVHYRVELNGSPTRGAGVKVASPRGFEPRLPP